MRGPDHQGRDTFPVAPTKEERSFPMDTQNPSAPTRAQSRTAGKNHPHAGGVVHENARHTERFTVIGNHLAQHPELSLVARGLALYIQSLPAGAPVDIKTLAARFPEGRDRIAAALRDLEDVTIGDWTISTDDLPRYKD
jgi:hypothetical protein